MKRTTLFLILSFACGIANAQTQQGIVKTRGRLVDEQIVAGTRLSGATITLNFGNPLVSDGQGAFSFAVPTAKSYSLVNATKQGYTLADPEFTRRSFTYSATNPFYVVLEDENQRQADINAATRKIRKNLLARLDKLEEEIETLKAQNKLTEEEYQERLKQLYDNQSDSEKLIKDMAERYATTDYDQLDEFNRQVQMYIEEGELQKADSMICSKGNMEQRVAEYRNTVAANKKVREELEQSESGAAKTYEDLSQDLYRRHEIFLQKFQQDSALYCLKTRADLDTTNMEAVEDYASLCLKQKKFTECEIYYQICSRACIDNNDSTHAAVIWNNLGNLYSDLHDYTSSEMYYKLALECDEKLFNQDSSAYRDEVAGTQNNLGNMYNKIHDFKNSERYYMLALENRKLLFEQNPDEFRASIAGTQNNLGMLYYELHDYTNSEKYHKLALENRETLFNQNPDAYRANMAETQNNLGMMYSDIHDFTNSEKYYTLALENKELLFKQNPDAFRASLASTQSNLGCLYHDLRDYASSEKYHKLALENLELLSKQNPDAFREQLVKTQNNLGVLYGNIQDFSNSLKYYKLALENEEELFNKNPNVYRNSIAFTQNNLGTLYTYIQDLASSVRYYQMALENFELLFNQDPNTYRAALSATQNNLGALYSSLQDYENSERYYKLALENREILLKQNPDTHRFDLAQTQFNLGLLYKDFHDHTSSEKYLNLALENYELLSEQNPNAYSVYLAIAQNGLASLFADEKHLDEAIEAIDKAIAIIPIVADFYDTKGEILLMQGKNEEALEMWKKVLELNPNFLNAYPDGTNLSNGLKELGLIE